MNILLSWYSSEIPLCTHAHTHTHTHTQTHTHCVVPPAYVQLCNPPHRTAVQKIVLYSKQFFEGTGTADITLHNKSTFFPWIHTHV